MPAFKIPYESLDPLTIGAADDESKVYRDELDLEVADRNLLAAIFPDEPTHLADTTAAAAKALEAPVRPTISVKESRHSATSVARSSRANDRPAQRIDSAIAADAESTPSWSAASTSSSSVRPARNAPSSVSPAPTAPRGAVARGRRW